MTRMSTIYSRLSYGTGTALTGCGVSTKAYAGAVKTEVWILADKIAGLTLSDWAIIVGIACTVITCGVNQTTLPGGLSAGGNIDNTSKGKVLTQAIELSMSTPYIDFHYNGSSADYTARLIHDRQNRLNAQVQSFWVTDGRITASSTMPANPAIGTQLTSNPVRSLMAGRGAYGDVDGAYVQMYMEEQVGTEHRLVLYADGFGRTDAWIFRAGGTISTGKGDVLTTGSDVRLKDAFMEPQEGACRRINSLGVCEFNMKGETRRRRGFIAQQAEKVDDLYTFPGIEQEIDGEKFRVMNVDYTAIIADLVTVVQDLIRRVDALES